MSEAAMGEGMRAVRAGLPEPVKSEPTLPGPVFAADFHLPGRGERAVCLRTRREPELDPSGDPYEAAASR